MGCILQTVPRFLRPPTTATPPLKLSFLTLGCRRVSAVVCPALRSWEKEEISSPELVAREFADLNLSDKFCEEVGHVRIRQHVNPLSSSQMLVKRAEYWVNELALKNIHFLYANATVSFKQLVSTYPGPLSLVSILCPDPHFKKKHHKRRVVQKPLVDSIVESLTPGGQLPQFSIKQDDEGDNYKIFIQSDVLEVALDMRKYLDAESDKLVHIDSLNHDVLCDKEGWLLSNPMGIRTEREIHAELESARIYRRLYQKQC